MIYAAPETPVDEEALQEAAQEEAVEPTATPQPEETAAPGDAVLTEADVLGSIAMEAVSETPELTVRAYDYVEGVLSQATPFFTLEGAPEGADYSYAVAAEGSDRVTLKGDTFAVTQSGDYTFTFYLQNALGEVVDTSAPYHVIVDFSQAEQDSQAWMYAGNTKLYGTLSSLLRQAQGGETVYLLTTDVIALADTAALEAVTLAADPDRFGSEYGVIVSQTNPDGESQSGTVYVWLGVDVEPLELARDVAGAAPFTLTGVSLGGTALTDGAWVNGKGAIAFTVEDPDTANTYEYQISLDGGVTYQAIAPGDTLSGLSTPPTTRTAAYSVVFLAIDADEPGNTASLSLTLYYDNEAPVLLCKAGTDYTLNFYAGDAISGFSTSQKNVTFNGSATTPTWSAQLTLRGQNVYAYAVQYRGAGVIPAGSLGVRDQAGNVTLWGEAITITQSTGSGGTGAASGGSGASGGGSSGGSTRTVSHSASDYTTVTAYNGVELVVETGTMSTLTIGEQTLNLSLALDGSQPAPEGFDPAFHATFTDWNADNATLDAADTVDTLVLTAAEDALPSGGYGFVWTFDGSVYKKLAASGIDYLVLQVGDQVAALSTAGFSAGIRYNMYRAAGVASKAFTYTVRMTDTGALSLQVSVDGQTYSLTDDETSEFYYYNVYCGTVDMLSHPFGQQNIQGSAEGRQG